MQAVVESISKTSIIVSSEGNTHTLEGPAVMAIAPTLKLGDNVEFDSADKLTTIAKKKASVADAAPAPRVRGTSSAYVAPQKKSY